MKYLNSYRLFLEDKNSEIDVDNLEKDLKDKGVDITDDELQQKLAKNLTDQLKKQINDENPDIKVNVNDVVKESLVNKIFESHGLVASVDHLEHVIHSIEMFFSDPESAEVIGGDIKHLVELKDKKSGLWNTIKKILEKIVKSGGWVMSWIETAMIWFCNNILGFSLESSAKTTKWIFIAICAVSLICFIIIFGSKAFAVAASGGIITLFTKLVLAGPKLLWKKSVIGNIWKGIRAILNVKKIDEGEELLTLPELISYIDKLKKGKCSIQDFFEFTKGKLSKKEYRECEEVLNIFALSGKLDLSRTMQKSIHWQSHLDSEQKEELSNIIKSILSDKNKLKKVPFLSKLAGLSDDNSNREDLFKYLETRLKINKSDKSSSIKDTILNDILDGDIDYKELWAKKKAQTLYNAMKGIGTREKSIFNVFKNINPDTGKSYGDFTEKDFFAIYLAFNLQKNKDLIEWLFGDLNSSELSKLSDILDKTKWTNGYNISNIVRGSIDEYHKNKPKWSLSQG